MDTEILHVLKDIALEIRDLKQRVEDLCDTQTGKFKIPHRCPVCNGSAYEDKEDVICHSCDGKGIVWGW